MKPQEHLLALFKAGLSADPSGLGGAIASLLSDYLPSATERAVKEFAAHFEQRLKELHDRIDENIVKEDEFIELFKSTILVVTRSHKQERLRAAANLLSNGLLKSGQNAKLSYAESDHFVRALYSLSSGALELLATLASAPEETRKPERRTIGQMHSSLGDPGFIMGLARELQSFNFVDVSIPQFRTEDYQNCTVVITDFGQRFVQTVLSGAVSG